MHLTLKLHVGQAHIFGIKFRGFKTLNEYKTFLSR